MAVKPNRTRRPALGRFPLAAILALALLQLPLQGQTTYDLVIYLTKFGPHLNQKFELRVVDSANGNEVGSQTVESIPAADFSISFKNILQQGRTYYIDAYADFNGNMQYDPPPVDHAWRRTISKVSTTQSIIFEHNTDWTDIQFPVPGAGRPPKPVENPPPDPVATCDCDFNGDSLVNVMDVIAWLVQTRDGLGNSCLDWNADGKLAINDLVLLLIDIKRGKCTTAGGN
ncbi:MAG: hypothetical protein V1794_06785 [Candidatus Glassbacteria bacterium]